MSVFHLSWYIVSNLFKLRPYSCKMVSIFRPSLLRLPGFNLMNLALLKIYGLGISWTSLFMIMYITIYLCLAYFNLEILNEQNSTIFMCAVVLNLFLSQLLFLRDSCTVHCAVRSRHWKLGEVINGLPAHGGPPSGINLTELKITWHMW